nr:hypothetical protein [uncultured Rhodoferax sp.]
MRYPAGLVIGSGLLLRQRLLGAVLASAVLHGVLLSQLTPTARPQPEPEPISPVLMAHLWLPAPTLRPPPPEMPTMPAERSTTAKPAAPRTVRQPLVSVADVPSAAAIPTDTHTPQPQEPSSSSVPATVRPLDLSSQAIGQAVRRSTTPSLAQAAREQLGSEPAPAAARLGQHMAAGAVPDCLHNAPEGEGKPSPVAIGGLLALPFVAYAAMTGKCR